MSEVTQFLHLLRVGPFSSTLVSPHIGLHISALISLCVSPCISARVSIRGHQFRG